MIRLAAIAGVLLAGPAMALDFTLPAAARQTVQRNTAPDVYNAPVGVFAEGRVPVQTIEGDVARAAWRIDSPGLTPLQVMLPLRAQLMAAGFEVVLDCTAEACGGFDFRFATETLPGPNMYVNIRAFQTVTGVREADGEVREVVTLLASTSATSAYVQIIRAGALKGGGVRLETPTPSLPAAGSGADIVIALETLGHVVLSDLEFATGSADLGSEPFASLVTLAAYLDATPALRVALVGHTDAVGGLEPNIAISRSRARSVRQRLITEFGIAEDRLDAEGMGYLSPIANNLTAAGRDQNRRVEVVVIGPLEQ